MSTPSAQQQQIIDHVVQNPTTVVSAGAGTGKTTTMIFVILKLIELGAFTADQFCLITFTREAANTLREKIQSAIFEKITAGTQVNFWLEQNELLSLSFIGTIHSFCNWILSNHGYEKNVANTADIKTTDYLLRQAVQRVLHKDYATQQNPVWDDHILNIADSRDFKIEDWIVRGITIIQSRGFQVSDIVQKTLQYTHPNDVAQNKQRREHYATLLRESFQTYQQIKLNESVIDLHDILLRTEDLLKQGSVKSNKTCEQIRTQFPCIFVDEFQDTDNAQSVIINALYPRHQTGYKILVVGDEKQAIYGFRGADVRLLRQFSMDRNLLNPLPLTDTFRQHTELAKELVAFFKSCDNRIQNRQNCLGISFKSSRGATPKSIQSGPYIENVNVSVQPNSTLNHQTLEYALAMARDIDTLKRVHNVKEKDITILVRTNRQLNTLMRVVEANASHLSFELQHEDSGTFWQTPIVLSIYRLIEWILKGDKNLSLPNLVFRSPLFKLGSFAEFTTQLGSELNTPTSTSVDLNTLPTNYSDIYTKVKKLRIQSMKVSGTLILDHIEEEFAHNINQLVLQDRLNLLLLFQKARDVFFKERALTLQQLYEWLHLQIITQQEEAQLSSNNLVVHGSSTSSTDRKIRVMTIHQSKGKTLPYVLLPFASRVLDGDFYIPDILVEHRTGHDNRIEVNHEDIRSPECTLDLESQNIDRIEEEMRILYVALTRTAEKIYIYGHNRTGLIASPPTTNNQSSSQSANYWSWWDEFRYWNRSR